MFKSTQTSTKNQQKTKKVASAKRAVSTLGKKQLKIHFLLIMSPKIKSVISIKLNSQVFHHISNKNCLHIILLQRDIVDLVLLRFKTGILITKMFKMFKMINIWYKNTQIMLTQVVLLHPWCQNLHNMILMRSIV
jgi:hypothetical protein